VNKPETHNGNLAELPPALLPLTRDERWVAWTWEYRANKDGSGKWTKVPRVAEAMNPEFFAALLTVGKAKNGIAISNENLGYWLRANKDRIINGECLEKGSVKHGTVAWRLNDHAEKKS
jgi:hypothetical protein